MERFVPAQKSPDRFHPLEPEEKLPLVMRSLGRNHLEGKPTRGLSVGVNDLHRPSCRRGSEVRVNGDRRAAEGTDRTVGIGLASRPQRHVAAGNEVLAVDIEWLRDVRTYHRIRTYTADIRGQRWWRNHLEGTIAGISIRTITRAGDSDLIVAPGGLG